MRSAIVLVLFVSLAYCNSATQVDWSDGPNILGPVTEWGNSFYSETGIDWDSNTGIIQIDEMGRKYIATDAGSVSDTAMADFDMDGDSDVLVSANKELILWENEDGYGGNWIMHIIDSPVNNWDSVVFPVDIDVDGDFDILYSECGHEEDFVSWWENVDGKGVVWIKHTVEGTSANSTTMDFGDIDGDGYLDIVAASYSSPYYNTICWFSNSSTNPGTYSPAMFICSVTAWGPESVCLADITGDGYVDLIYENHGHIACRLNGYRTGNGWGGESFLCYDQSIRKILMSDVDNDGDVDALATTWNGEIKWWKNSSTGNPWEGCLIAEDFPGAYDFCIQDIDGDGDIDVIATGSSRTSWWENADGIGTSWQEHTIDSAFTGGTINCGDINGDGNADFLSSSTHASAEEDVCWWDTSPQAGFLESSILDAGDIGKWDFFQSISEEPIGTSVSFQFRSSNDPSSMGAWSDTVFSPETLLEGILADSTRYLQYRVFLQTEDFTLTPELHEVTFSYFPLGIEENSSTSWSLNTLSNPSYGIFSALVSVPEDVSVELMLFDISGRVVAEVSEKLPAGNHTVNFARLAEGVYFCKMDAGEFSATERVVVLE